MAASDGFFYQVSETAKGHENCFETKVPNLQKSDL
jgi:hypothetical protein